MSDAHSKGMKAKGNLEHPEPSNSESVAISSQEKGGF